MSLRAISVVALTLAVFGSQASFAEVSRHYKHSKYSHHHGVVVTRIQPGHGDGEQTKPEIYVDKRVYINAPYYNNDLTFWERIEYGQPDYPVR